MSEQVSGLVTVLEAERVTVLERLGRIDAALLAVRALVGLPSAVVPATVAPARVRVARTRAITPDDLVNVRRALAAGPLAPGKLAALLGVTVANLRHRLRPLVEAGDVVMSGTTATRMVSLPAAAKEAPCRPGAH